MTQMHPIPIALPLAVGAIPVVCTIAIHTVTVIGTVNFFRLEKRRGHTGSSLWIDVAIVAPVILFAFMAHMVEIAIWAALFMICGEFRDFGTAYYHSAVNYTTLGYGDIIMSPAWRLLGPMEGADGALMFGVSTAMIFAVISRLIVTRYRDLGD